MKSLLDGLPPEVAQQIHPDWQRHETAYWAVRDTLLPHYRNQWIAFAHGRVLVSGTSAVEVLHAAQASGLHPFVTCVGREHEPSRMRRAVFAYDTTYPQEALPVIPVECRPQEAVPGLVYAQVIPDTGADASALPWADCAQLALDPRQGVPGLIGGGGCDVGLHDRLCGLGVSRWADVSLSVASGFHRTRTHPWARCAQSPRHPLPGTSPGSRAQSLKGSGIRVAGLRVGPCSRGAPNKAVEPTPNSFRSYVASAIGRGSPPAFGVTSDRRGRGQ